MARCAAYCDRSVAKCAYAAPSHASFAFGCSVLFSALHFFCFAFFSGKEMPQGACV